MIHRDALQSHRDGQLARKLVRVLGRDEWSVDWARLEDGLWLARVTCPSPPVAVEATGSSRVSSLSAAHVALVRLLDVPPLRIPDRGVRRC